VPARQLDSLYRIEWREQVAVNPQTAKLAFPAAASVRELCLASPLDSDSLQQMAPGDAGLQTLDNLSGVVIGHALRKLGLSLRVRTKFSAKSLMERFAILPNYRRALGRLLAILAEQGFIEQRDDAYRVIQQLPSLDLDEELGRLRNDNPNLSAAIDLFQRCALVLAEILTGGVDVLDVLFPSGSVDDASAVNSDTPEARQLNARVRQAVNHLLASAPAGRKVRLLEIGAGTGATTAQVVPELQADRVSYTFTDISPLFIAQAQERFGDYPFLDYRTLDIEQEPGSQGFEDGQYEIIIAANVLHATEDLGRSLRHARRLLVPGGYLVLLEVTRPRGWMDLTFGLTEGWWRFADTEVRPDYPLLNVSAWERLLVKVGFAEVAVLSTDPDPDQAVMVACAGEDIAVAQRPWLVFASAQKEGDRLRAGLDRLGIAPMLIYPGERFEARGDDSYSVAPRQLEDYRKLIAELDERDLEGVLFLWGAKAPIPEAGPQVGEEDGVVSHSLLNLVQTLLATRWTNRLKLWLVTRAAQAVPGRVEAPGFDAAPLVGFGRALRREWADVDCRLVDIEADAPLDNLLLELDQPGSETEVAFSDGQRYVPRLTRFEPKREKRLRFKSDASYLITGGLGGVGLLVAQWMVERGARSLILLGRRGVKSADPTQLEALRRSPARLSIVESDVRDYAELAAALEGAMQGLPPLRGVIHSVGVLHDARLSGQTWESFREVLAPKIAGAWNLHQLTADLPLDFLVLFSSMASLLGTPGQTNHAAANAYLDSFAAYLRSRGRPAVSINWGAWAQAGAAVRHGVEKRLAGTGVEMITTADGLRALELAMSDGEAQVAMSPADWSKTGKAVGAGFTHLFDELIKVSQTHETPADQLSDGEPDILSQLRNAAASRHHSMLMAHIESCITKTLRMTKSSIDHDQRLFDIGLDSLMAMEVRTRLQNAFDTDLPATLLFDYPTIRRLADYLFDQVVDLRVNHEKQTTGADEVLDEELLEIAQMADDEVSALLMETLQDL
jgi:microcystin synthetase protein McyG